MKTKFVPVEWSPTCTRCGGYAYEWIGTRRHNKETYSLIQCVWCLQTTPSKWRPIVSNCSDKEKEFVFDTGRFCGRTIEQVADTEDGVAYLNLIACGDLQTSEECVDAVKTYFEMLPTAH